MYYCAWQPNLHCAGVSSMVYFPADFSTMPTTQVVEKLWNNPTRGFEQGAKEGKRGKQEGSLGLGYAQILMVVSQLAVQSA